MRNHRIFTLALAVMTLLLAGCQTSDVVEGEPRNTEAMAYFAQPQTIRGTAIRGTAIPRTAAHRADSPGRRIAAKIPVAGAASLAPALVPNHRDQDLSELAVDALARIGSSAVEGLVATLDDPNQVVRLRAIKTLSRIGPDAHAAATPLTKLLSDDDPVVRRAAVRALGQIGPPAEGAIEALLRELRRPNAAEPPAENKASAPRN